MTVVQSNEMRERNNRGKQRRSVSDSGKVRRTGTIVRSIGDVCVFVCVREIQPVGFHC